MNQEMADMLDKFGMGGFSPKDALMEDAFAAEGADEAEDPHMYSQADIIADIVNIQRADNKKLADLFDVDIEVEKMTPERAAEVLADAVMGQPATLIEVFNGLEEQRDYILEAGAKDDRFDFSEEDYHGFVDYKRTFLYSAPNPEAVDERVETPAEEPDVDDATGRGSEEEQPETDAEEEETEGEDDDDDE